MKRTALIYFILISFHSLYSQNFENFRFGTDSTFDVMTWNIQNFPKSNQISLNHVTEVVKALDIDFIAVQEIADSNAFKILLDSLNEYDGFLGSIYFVGLACIYKKGVVQLNDIYEIYNTFPYKKAFPRAPLVADINYNGERMIIINNHFKCCGDGIIEHDNTDDEETRRYQATNLLKVFAESMFPEINVIITGDLNDILTKEPANNVFQNILNDAVHYVFADHEIAFGPDSNWSFPDWPAHIDHIILNNFLFDEFNYKQSDIQTIKIEESFNNGWSDYFQEISDHRPVALKLYFDTTQNTGINYFTDFNTGLNAYPNPFNAETNILFKPNLDKAEIIISTIHGKFVFSEKLNEGKSSFIWKPENLAKGIYFATLRMNGENIASVKLVKQ